MLPSVGSCRKSVLVDDGGRETAESGRGGPLSNLRNFSAILGHRTTYTVVSVISRTDCVDLSKSEREEKTFFTPAREATRLHVESPVWSDSPLHSQTDSQRPGKQTLVDEFLLHPTTQVPARRKRRNLALCHFR